MEKMKVVLKAFGVALLVAAILVGVVSVGTLMYNKAQDTDEATCLNYGEMLRMDHKSTSSGCLLEIQPDRWVRVSDLCVQGEGSDTCIPVRYGDPMVVITPPPKG